MNDPCPCCGLLFEREEGYFLGALYISYPIAAAIMIVFYYVACAYLPNLNERLLPVVAVLAFLPFVAPVFRYSRVLWIYLDRLIDPTGALAGAYEKLRLQQIAASRADPAACRSDDKG
jgi:hypothetical protein